jgi:hypothetical protein
LKIAKEKDTITKHEIEFNYHTFTNPLLSTGNLTNFLNALEKDFKSLAWFKKYVSLKNSAEIQDANHALD